MPTFTGNIDLPLANDAEGRAQVHSLPFSISTLDVNDKPGNCAAVTDQVYTDMKTTLVTTINSLNSFSASLLGNGVLQNVAITDTDTFQNFQFLLDLNSGELRDNSLASKNFAREKLYYELAANCKDSPDTMLTSYTDQKKITETAKLRLESIQSPEEKVSYYEGWFPLNRPLNDVSLFVLFSLSILFLLISVSVFLRMGGVEFNFLAQPTGGFAAFLAQFGFMLETYRLPILYGLGTGALIGSVGMYLYTKYA